MKEQRTIGIIIAALLGVSGLLIIQFVLGTVATTLMQRAIPTLTSTEKFIFSAAIQLEDLPPGWRSEIPHIENVPGAESRIFGFVGTNDPDLTWIRVTEMLFVFEDEKRALSHYQEQVVEYIPPHATDSWKHIPELDFSHHADEIKVACLPGYINGKHHFACSAIARYQNVVIVILGNVFDDRWLTMVEFRAVLEAMDRRIVAAMGQSK